MENDNPHYNDDSSFMSEDDEENESLASGGTSNSRGRAMLTSSPTNAQPSEPVDPTMVISATERQWALELKRAVMESEDLAPLNDFEYAQHAIVAEGNLEEALVRVERMQDFRQYYKVNSSVEQGLHAIEGLMTQQPGFMLHLDVDPIKHNSINVIDLGFFDPHVALGIGPDGKENWPRFICGIYYMKYTSQPSMAVIRNGFFALADFGDVDNFNFKPEAQQRLFVEVLSCYPFLWKQFLAYNTGYVATIKLTLAKTLMSEKMRNVVQLGCHIEESDESRNPAQRLRDFYLLPTMIDAYQHILVRAHALLERRKHNEKIFRLS